MIANGTKLGRYEIRSKIGAGGMGEVYLEEDEKHDLTVGINILRSDVSSKQERMRRFVQEAKAAAAVNHPNSGHLMKSFDARVNGFSGRR